MDRIQSGNQELDFILGGGFPARSIHIVMGAPGTGKTILAEQLAFTALRERPTLYLATLSEPLSKLITYLQECTFADQDRLGAEVIYESLAEEVCAHPERLPESMLALIQQFRPGIIIIDSLKALADLMPDMSAWRRVLYALAGLLSAYDTTTFWVGEYTSEMVTHLPEFAVADGIIELVREQRGSSDDRYLRVVKMRGSAFQDGYHAFYITAAGLDVFPRLLTPDVSEEYAPIPERLTSGITGLDEMIETGWLRGTSTLVAGRSGAGKTVLGLHFLREGAERGEPSLLVNFQENPTQLLRVIQNFGWDPETLLGPRKLDIFYTSPIEMQIDSIVREMFRRIESNGVRRVVIDAIGDLEKNARDPVRLTDYLYALTQQFAVRNVTALLLIETPPPYTPLWASGPGKDIFYMSDNTVLLEIDIEAGFARSVRVVKSRGSAHEGRRHRLHIGSHGITVEHLSHAGSPIHLKRPVQGE